jgi:response regulator RpfG family c-di-GMP phosphodiesterase
MNPQGSTYGVLIVDDDPAVLQALTRVLRDEGYALHTASDGPTAIEILGREPIATIICDQKMPGMSGDQVLAEAYQRQPNAVRITLTGATALAGAQSSINAGRAQYLLLKPWDDDHVRALVREGINTHHVIQERNRLEALSRKQQVELEDWNRKLEQEVQRQTETLKKQNQELSELQCRVEQSLHDTVAVLAGLLDLYSPNLGMHAKRVAQTSRALAELVGLCGLDLRDVEFAAFLHDIGKIRRAHDDHHRHGEKQSVALSPSRSAEAGHSILSRVNGFEEIARAVRHQAERFDSGDPPGRMRGEAIPLASRIIAVANAYDEAAFRPHDPTHISPEAGRRALVRARGKHLDPKLVDRFIQSVLDDPSTTRDGIEVEVAARSAQVGMVLSRPLHNAEGLLLLQKGTVLTQELIEKIRAWCDADPLLSGLFVRCTSLDASDAPQSELANDSEQDAPTAPATRPPTVSNIHRTESKPTNAQEASLSPIAGGTSIQTSAMNPNALIDFIESGPKRVLVADDSAFIRNALKRELRRSGIEVSEAADGLAALRLIRSTRFDAALIDLRMPRMSGEELVAKAREIAPYLRCVILTGNATLDSVLKLLSAPNVAGILTKPWNPDRLISTLQAAMHQHPAESANAAP